MEFRLLNAEEIDCRVSQVYEWGIKLLLYKDARCDMNILDESVGAERWQRTHELINGNLFCNVGINFPDASGFDRWVWKQDVGTESYTEKEKGQASDSFKRACFNWGIGRELYTAPNMIVYKKDLSSIEPKNGKLTCKDTFEVTEIEYVNKKIVYVKILNQKTKSYIEFGTSKEEAKVVEEVKKSKPTEAHIKTIQALAEKKGYSEANICNLYEKKKFTDLTFEEWNDACNKLKEKPDKEAK